MLIRRKDAELFGAACTILLAVPSTGASAPCQPSLLGRSRGLLHGFATSVLYLSRERVRPLILQGAVELHLELVNAWKCRSGRWRTPLWAFGKVLSVINTLSGCLCRDTISQADP